MLRSLLFHPAVYYPLVALFAAGVILFSLAPQAWPRAAEPQTGAVADGAVLLENAAFDAPAGSPDQNMHVVRDFWGNAQALRIAVLPNMPEPTPAEQGVRVLLTPNTAAMLNDVPVTIEVTYRPVPINMATGLAVSLQGIAPADWVIQPTPPQSGTLRFELPASFAVEAIGLRAMSEQVDQAYGIEIVRVRAIPHAAPPPPAGG